VVSIRLWGHPSRRGFACQAGKLEYSSHLPVLGPQALRKVRQGRLSLTFPHFGAAPSRNPLPGTELRGGRARVLPSRPGMSFTQLAGNYANVLLRSIMREWNTCQRIADGKFTDTSEEAGSLQ